MAKGRVIFMEKIGREKEIAEASKAIFRFAMARCGNTADAEDLSQEIVCALCASLGELRDERAFYGFMWSVAENVYRKWLSKRRRESFIELSAELPDVPEETEESEDIRLLRRELSILSGKYRQATILYYIERKSCARIASEMSVSESMVKYLLFKSRQKLREGMAMQRENGTLSYAPKRFTPMYSGEGPNRFYDFMGTLIRQNILAACVNDELKEQEISLETGVPLPYLEGEIEALVRRKLLVREGSRYRTNVVIADSDCVAEIRRECAEAVGKIAKEASMFIEDRLPEFRRLGFRGSELSDTTLRWQLAAFLFRQLRDLPCRFDRGEMPLTGWGERAYIWLEEVCPDNAGVLSYCTIHGRQGGKLLFLDYIPGSSGDHRDFFGDSGRTEILFAAVRGEEESFSEYDREIAVELIRMGYLRQNGGRLTAAFPVLSAEQFSSAEKMAEDFVRNRLSGGVERCFSIICRVLSEHMPKKLSGEVRGAALGLCFRQTAGECAKRLVDAGTLSAAWRPDEVSGALMVI